MNQFNKNNPGNINSPMMEPVEEQHGFWWEMVHSGSGWLTIGIFLHGIIAQIAHGYGYPIDGVFIAWGLLGVWCFALFGTGLMLYSLSLGCESAIPKKKQPHANP